MKPIFLVLFCLAYTTAAAHHSSAIFDEDREIVVDGVVSRFEWKNPHVYIYVDASDDSGQPVQWLIEGDDIRTMMGSGWTATSLVAGERVEVRSNPDRNAERHHALMVELTKIDGTSLTPEDLDAPDPTIEAESIFSLWNPSRFVGAYLDSGTPTEMGAAAQSEYTPEDSPLSQCIPPPPPATVTAGLIQISRQGEHIRIQSEEFQIERIVYMDERPHPTHGERTIHGHSIGRWDGDVLVVDTVLFSDYLDGSLFGIPSGAQKHLVERFELTNAGTQLQFEFELEDPEYLEEPATGGLILDHAPDATFTPGPCDPESARSWIGE